MTNPLDAHIRRIIWVFEATRSSTKGLRKSGYTHRLLRYNRDSSDPKLIMETRANLLLCIKHPNAVHHIDVPDATRPYFEAAAKRINERRAAPAYNDPIVIAMKKQIESASAAWKGEREPPKKKESGLERSIKEFEQNPKGSSSKIKMIATLIERKLHFLSPQNKTEQAFHAIMNADPEKWRKLTEKIAERHIWAKGVIKEAKKQRDAAAAREKDLERARPKHHEGLLRTPDPNYFEKIDKLRQDIAREKKPKKPESGNDHPHGGFKNIRPRKPH